MIKHYTEVPAERVEMEETEGATIRWLIAEREGAPNFYMRLFEIEPGGYSPRHGHNYEHEIFILEGQGTALYEGEEQGVEPGYFLFVPPNAEHQLRNTGNGILKFLCFIPKR